MAGRIPRTFIDDLIQRCDIVEIINQRVSLRKRGVNFIACCPFHNEKTPSFTVSPSKQIYHCFGCGVSGNAITFLMEFDRLDFVETIETIASQLGMEVPYEQGQGPSGETQQQKSYYQILEQICQFYQQQLQRSQAKQAREYLEKRGINQAISSKYKLGFAPEGWNNLTQLLGNNPQTIQSLLATGMLIKKENNNVYDRFRNRIMYPIHDRRGRVIAFGGRAMGDATPKYLNSPETVLFHKSQELYGWHQAQQNREKPDSMLVVEGYMDVIALAQFGIQNVVATLGTAATVEHMRRLFRYYPNLIFCFDGDQAGRTAAWRALNNLLPVMQDGYQAKFMFLPEGDDPDSFIRTHGKAGFVEQFNQALPFSDFLFQHLLTETDISSMDGKAKLAKLCAPIMNKLPQGVLKHMLKQQLGKVLRIDVNQLDGLLSNKNTPPEAKQTINLANQSLQPTPMRIAIALLLQNPQLITSTINVLNLSNLQLPGTDLFLQIIEIIKTSPHITTAGLIEKFRNHSQAAFVNKLAMWNHHVPDEGVVDEFNGAIICLKHQAREQQMEALLTKAAIQSLSPEEKLMLQNLINEKHQQRAGS